MTNSQDSKLGDPNEIYSEEKVEELENKMNEDFTVKEEKEIVKIEETCLESELLLNISDVTIVSVAYLEACLDYVCSFHLFVKHV